MSPAKKFARSHRKKSFEPRLRYHAQNYGMTRVVENHVIVRQRQRERMNRIADWIFWLLISVTAIASIARAMAGD